MIVIIGAMCGSIFSNSYVINILSNGGFERGLNGWSPAARVIAYVDTNEAYEGHASLRMEGDSYNSWNVVRSELVPCMAEETYTIKFYSKNAVYPGAIYAGFRWTDRSGQTTIRYDWYRLQNDTPWEPYAFTANPPAGASLVQVLFRLSQNVDGFVWFDDVSLLEGPLEGEFTSAGPMGFRGSVTTEVSYTPEERWLAGNRLQLYTDIAFGTSAKAYVHLGGWLPRPDETVSFAGGGSTHAQFNIKHAYIEIDGPWLRGTPNVRTTLGDVSLGYSPYVLQLDRWDLWYWDVMEDSKNPLSYNRMRRGVSVESLEQKKVKGAGFLIFDGHPDIYAYGGKIRFEQNDTKVNTTAINYLDKKDIPSGEKPKLSDLSYSLEAETTTFGFGVKALLANNIKEIAFEPKKEASFNLASLTYPINQYCNVTFSHWNVDQDFDPIFRDRNPKYNPYTGEKLGWNPVDRYLGQVGTGIGIDIINSAFNLKLQGEQALQSRDVEQLIDNKAFKLTTNLYHVDFILSGEIIETQTEENELGTKNLFVERHYYGSALYPLSKMENLDLNLEGNYRLHEGSRRESNKHVLVSGLVKTGIFQGAKLFVGKRYVSKPEERLNGIVTGVDLKIAKAINLSIRYADPRESKTVDEKGRLPAYDRYGDEFIADNIIKLNAVIEF